MQNLQALISFAQTHEKAITKWAQLRDTNFDDTFNVFNLFSSCFTPCFRMGLMNSSGHADSAAIRNCIALCL
ncbi:MAG: hypothetical protein ACPGLV_12780, partial [Bacteroidia bacterium]